MRINKIMFVAVSTLCSSMLVMGSINNSNRHVLISENVEALTSTYEIINVASGGFYSPIEMGNSPTDSFRESHPNYKYVRMPSSTYPNVSAAFYNLGTRAMENINMCWENDNGWDWVVPNGKYCFVHFSGSGGLNADSRGNIIWDRD